MGEVAVACEDVNIGTWDCCGGQGGDFCELGRGLGSGEEQCGDGDAGEAFGLPVPALFDASLSDDRVDAGDALRSDWRRPPFRDLTLREPRCGPHLNKKAFAVARRDPLLDPIEGTG
jgi:hypothetical protein